MVHIVITKNRERKEYVYLRQSFRKGDNVVHKNLKSTVFIPILDYCRDLIRKGRKRQNVLRYLLYNMNNVIIKSQYSDGYYSKYYDEYTPETVTFLICIYQMVAGSLILYHLIDLLLVIIQN